MVVASPFMWHPWRRLRELPHIDVTWCELDNRYGETDVTTGSIRLQVGMTQAERRSTLTHELIHLERGRCSPEHDHKEEAAVDRLAAKRRRCPTGGAHSQPSRSAGVLRATSSEPSDPLDTP